MRIKYLTVMVCFLFLGLQCKSKIDQFSFKKSELNSGTKQLVDKYLEYSNIPKSKNEISIQRYSNNNQNIYVLTSGSLTNNSISLYKKEEYYLGYYKGYNVFIVPELKNQLFVEGGFLNINNNDVKNVDEKTIPLTEDISSWEFRIIEGKIADLKYQFCTLTKSQVSEIESIIF